jgi:hypothetical protein
VDVKKREREREIERERERARERERERERKSGNGFLRKRDEMCFSVARSFRIRCSRRL